MYRRILPRRLAHLMPAVWSKQLCVVCRFRPGVGSSPEAFRLRPERSLRRNYSKGNTRPDSSPPSERHLNPLLYEREASALSRPTNIKLTEGGGTKFR